MEIIIVLIGISISIASVFLVLFIWNIRNGQYEDTYTPSIRILFGNNKTESGKERINSGQKAKDKVNGAKRKGDEDEASDKNQRRK